MWIYLLLLLAPVSAAEVDIHVDEAGLVDVSGAIDIDKSSEFTSKKQSYWLLNLTLNYTEPFSYRVHLPPYTEVNYIRLPKSATIEQSQTLIIKGDINEPPLELVVQYRLQTENQVPWIKLGIMFVLLIAAILFIPKQKKKPYVVSERQQKIIDVIQNHGGQTTQKRVESALLLPKSSISRNIDSLVKKNILEKHKTGATNTLKLK